MYDGFDDDVANTRAWYLRLALRGVDRKVKEGNTRDRESIALKAKSYGVLSDFSYRTMGMLIVDR